MGLTLTKTPNKLFESLMKTVNKALRSSLNKSAQFMAKQLDLAYENDGFKQTNMRKKGFEPWKPTTRVAKKARKTYPKANTTQKTGAKGYTQAQARYLFAAPTLEDTGKLRASIAIDVKDLPDKLEYFIGASEKYIETHEKGGSISVNGNTYKVPARRNQFITDEEQRDIEQIFKKELSK